LLAALSLWCGFGNVLPFFVVMCFVGGAVGILVYTLRQFGIPVWLAAHGWHIPALDIDKSKALIPYAPAMAFAFIYIGYSGFSF
jgi:Flp pilus assembly protein protease CpaA